MTFTINSRDHGVVHFSLHSDGGYVRVEFADRRFQPRQICYGGGYRGATVTSTYADLPAVARRWWRQHLTAQRAGGRLW